MLMAEYLVAHFTSGKTGTIHLEALALAAVASSVLALLAGLARVRLGLEAEKPSLALCLEYPLLRVLVRGLLRGEYFGF